MGFGSWELGHGNGMGMGMRMAWTGRGNRLLIDGGHGRDLASSREHVIWSWPRSAAALSAVALTCVALSTSAAIKDLTAWAGPSSAAVQIGVTPNHLPPPCARLRWQPTEHVWPPRARSARPETVVSPQMAAARTPNNCASC